MTTLFAYVHHVAVLVLVGCTLLSALQWNREFDLRNARLLRTADMLNGIAATLVLLVGLVRVFYLEKGADYYFHNGPFIVKLALYGVASVLSLAPTLEIRRWRVPLARGELPPVLPRVGVRMRRLAYGQLGCIGAMGVCAHLAARGISF